MEPVAKKRSPILTWTQHLVTIAVSAGICYYYLHKVDWGTVLASLDDVNLPLAALGVALPNLAWWFVDARLNQRLVNYFHGPLELWGIFWVRGFSYLAMIVFPPLAEGGVLLYLYRKTGMSRGLFAGVVFFKFINMSLGGMFMVSVAVVCALASGVEFTEHVSGPMWIIGLGFGYFGLFHAWSYWIAGHSWGPLDRILDRESEFFIPYAQGTLKHWAVVWAYTIAGFMTMLTGYYLVALAFDVYVPPRLFFLLAPLMLMLASLPVFFSGFGSTTVFWTMFFPDSGDPAAILALTLFLPTVRMLVRMAMGLVSLVPAQKDLALMWRGEEEAEEEV